jgi:membrane protease YdiL (CAAX protease family)
MWLVEAPRERGVDGCPAKRIGKGVTQMRFVRILWAVVLWAFVYFVGLWVVPSVAVSLGLPSLWPWAVKNSVPTQATFLVLSLLLIWLLGKRDFRTYGLRLPALRPLGMAVLVSAAAMLVFMILMVFVTTAVGPKTPAQGPPQTRFGLLNTIIAVWLIASTCEEFFYRGLLQGFLDSLRTYGLKIGRLYFSVPVIFCALAFGLGHLCLLGKVSSFLLPGILVSTTLGGFVAGYYREKSGSIVPAIAAHMTFNIVGTMVPFVLTRIVRV